jgi:hypothetical protein
MLGRDIGSIMFPRGQGICTARSIEGADVWRDTFCQRVHSFVVREGRGRARKGSEHGGERKGVYVPVRGTRFRDDARHPEFCHVSRMELENK